MLVEIQPFLGIGSDFGIVAVPVVGGSNTIEAFSSELNRFVAACAPGADVRLEDVEQD